MKTSATARVVAVLIAFLSGAHQGLAQPVARPVAGKGSEAKTLLVFANARPAYSLADGLESLRLHLQRVATRLETVTVSNAAPDRIAGVDYLVVYCPQPFPDLSRDFLRSIVEANKPVLWIGFGADNLARLSPFNGQFEISAFAAGNAVTRVTYRGRDWSVAVDPWIPAALPTNSASQVILSFQERVNDGTAKRPLCWKTAAATFFLAEPSSGALGFLFEDLLLDFFEVKGVPPQRVFVRIEDYHCRSNHREFRRKADYLYSRGHPFIVAVVPVVRDPSSGELLDMDSQAEFVESLRYAQQRGGRLIVREYAFPARDERNEEHPFWWDLELDRPITAQTAGSMRERLLRGVRQMPRQGLFPLAWETPHYVASGAAYAEIGKVFSTAVERVQLSDATSRANSEIGGLTLDRHGRLIVPENLGYVLDAPLHNEDAIRARAEILARLRGTVAGCVIHAYQPLEKLTGLVETLEGFSIPFLDLADLDDRVELPDALLLVGGARRTVTLRNALVRWKAFDRAGNLLAEKQEPAISSGKRDFQRTGAGDYQLFEFGEASE